MNYDCFRAINISKIINILDSHLIYSNEIKSNKQCIHIISYHITYNYTLSIIFHVLYLHDCIYTISKMSHGILFRKNCQKYGF